VEELARRCEGLGIRIHVDDGVKDYLIEKHVNLQYGARPLKRAVQSELEDVISEKILGDEIHPGADVSIQMSDGRILMTER
jgi:ATP-dependent Clp protease ATP-binding subunit ClpC